MQIPVRKGYHAVSHPLNRAGNGTGQAQNQQDRYGQHSQSGQHGHQHGSVDQVIVVGLGNLDNQGPLGSPDR